MRITSEPDGAAKDVQRVRDALGAFNVQATGAKEYWPIRVFLHDDSGALQGGLVGDIWGGWFHVELLWLGEALRRRGHGSRLLRAAEEEARRKGARWAYLETFSFQARPFYERFGYEVFAELADYPPGHRYYFMAKALG